MVPKSTIEIEQIPLLHKMQRIIFIFDLYRCGATAVVKWFVSARVSHKKAGQTFVQSFLAGKIGLLYYHSVTLGVRLRERFLSAAMTTRIMTATIPRVHRPAPAAGEGDTR